MEKQELEETLATVHALLLAEGMDEAANLVKAYPAHVEQTGHDNWNGGIEIWDVQFEVPAHEFALLGAKRAQLEEQITARLKTVLEQETSDWYSAKMVPAKEKRADWRADGSNVAGPMFHLMVTASKDAWHQGVEEYPRSRFLEYTSDEIASSFETLNTTSIKQLKSLPCLCAYEGQEDLWVAKITEIEQDKHALRVFVEIDKTIGPIDYLSFFQAKKHFGVHEWEFSRTHWAIKNGDLFTKLKHTKLISVEAAAASPTVPMTVSPPFVDSIGNLVVATVTDFITEVKKLGRTDRECFYRGHSDANYRLMPSVFRTDASGVPLYRDSEHEIFREILVSNSFDFREDSSTLDRLVRMQHYLLPTRLLDITANPLIALFFAAWSEEKRGIGGEVILFHIPRSKIKYFDSDTASCLANIALMSSKDMDQIAFPPESGSGYEPEGDPAENLLRFNEQEQMKRLLHYIANEKPYFKPAIRPHDLRSIICVKSKRSNDRISSQSGAFLLFGHDTVLNEDGTDDIAVKRIRIANKAQILQELELLNITESTVFPNIESSARDIARKFRTKNLSDTGETDSILP